MKKILFPLFSLIVTALAIYACQKDHSEQAAPTTDANNLNLPVASRDFTDCDACYENCYDCCLKLERGNNTGSVRFTFMNSSGQLTTRVLTSTSPGPVYVCAGHGYFGMYPTGGCLGKVSVCGSPGYIECTNPAQGTLNVNTCFISLPPCQ